MALDGLLRARASRRPRHPQRHRRQRVEPRRPIRRSPRTYSALRIDMRAAQQGRAAERSGLTPSAAGRCSASSRGSPTRRASTCCCTALPGSSASGGQLALLGSGDRALEDGFRGRRRAQPGSVGCVFGYDEGLRISSRRGSDFIVVPSRFEPCGLTQLCALRYGAMPIVARVGGLADTVIDANEAALPAGVATGVQFAPPSVDALSHALDRALRAFRDAADDAPHEAQRHARRRLLARPGQALRRALSRPRGSGRMNDADETPLGVAVAAARRSRPRSTCPTRRRVALPLRRRPARSSALRLSARRRRRPPRRSPGFGAGARYGLRVEGPFEPPRGDRFDAVEVARRPLRLAPSTGRSNCILRCSPSARTAAPMLPRRLRARRRRASRDASASRGEQLVIYELNLRGFTRLQRADPGERARNLRRPRPSGVDRAFHAPRRHRGRDHAGRRLRRRAPPAAARSVQRLGLQSRRVRRARPASRARRLGRSARRDRRAACRRHGGHARRRVQPQRRERRARPDPVVPRPRQRHLLPPRPRRSGGLRQRHRLRQLPCARPAAGRRHGARRAAGAGWSTAASTASASISRRRSGATRPRLRPERAAASRRSPPIRS